MQEALTLGWSQSSFMSGVRPDVTGIFNFANNIVRPSVSQLWLPPPPGLNPPTRANAA